MFFLRALPGAIADGLIWGLVAIGIYISFKILDIADMTVDGSICTGGIVCLVLLDRGLPVWLCVILAFLAGALCGCFTGLLHTVLGIPSILAGILTQLMLYSVNVRILDGASLAVVPPGATLLLSSSEKGAAILTGALFVVGTIICLWLFFYTEIGLTIKSTGDNPDMSRAQGVNVDRNKVIGLAIANGIVAVAGALYAQFKGSMSLSEGRGAIVIGLAAIFIGLSVSMKIKPYFIVSLIGVVCGAIVYYIIYNFVILLGLDTDYLKMLTSLIVILFMGVPYIKGRYFTKRKPLPIAAQNQSGGASDA